MRDQYLGEPLGHFASELLIEVQADNNILQDLADRLGSTGGLKKVAAWLDEKVSRTKLKHGGDDFGTFEALELLALGIQGKLALWRALAAISPGDTRLSHLNLAQLLSRAETQHTQAEERRLEAAHNAFRPFS